MLVKASRSTSKIFYDNRTNGMVDRRRPIDWSREARADLSEIWNYYVNVAGRNTADKIVREIGEVWLLCDYCNLPILIFPRLKGIYISTVACVL
jgi:hypothetical protein